MKEVHSVSSAEIKGFSTREEMLRRQTLLEHLRDLRKTIFICIGMIGLSFVVIFFGFAEPLVAFLTRTITNQGIAVVYTALTETFAVQFKASLLAGFICAVPVILWQVWAFIAPALYRKERRQFTWVYFIAILLFLVGVLFAYGVVFGMAVNFFITTGENLATPMISIDSYVNFLVSFIVPFGTAFELPLIIAVLSRLGLVSVATLTKIRKYFILVAFLIAAILTPPDILSQVMLGIPLILLYEIGILVARAFENAKRKNADAA